MLHGPMKLLIARIPCFLSKVLQSTKYTWPNSANTTHLSLGWWSQEGSIKMTEQEVCCSQTPFSQTPKLDFKASWWASCFISSSLDFTQQARVLGLCLDSSSYSLRSLTVLVLFPPLAILLPTASTSFHTLHPFLGSPRCQWFKGAILLYALGVDYFQPAQ